MKPIPELKSWEIEKFWSNCTPVGECLEWQGVIDKNGRARIYLQRDRYYASRVAYKICFDEDPRPFQVCHHCDNGKCVNPNHFFLGDDKANRLDMADKRRNRRNDGTHFNAVLTTEQAEQILNDNGEHSDQYWADKFSILSTTVNQIRNRHIYKYIDADPSPSRHKNQPKLNEEQVRKIRLAPLSISQRKLAREYGVDKVTIAKVQNQESYHQYLWTADELATKDKRTKQAKGRRSTVTAEQIELMFRMHAEGKTQTEIATVLDISRSRVSQLLKQHR